MPTLYMLIGPPASGKSTTVRLLAAHGATVVCPDEFRVQYPEWSQNNATLFRTIHELVQRELRAGRDVAYDAMNVYPQWRRSLIAIAYRLRCDVVGIQMDTPLPTCLERHATREQNVSQQTLTTDIITQLWQAMQLHPPTLTEGFTRIHCLTPSDDPHIVLSTTRFTSP